MTIYDNIKKAWYGSEEVELTTTTDLPYRPKLNKPVCVKAYTQLELDYQRIQELKALLYK